MIKELWKPVVGYEGTYEVSSKGRVRSLDRHVPIGVNHKRFYKGKILAKHKGVNGYMQLRLAKDGKRKTFRIGRLVGMAFISNPDKKETINHINGLKDDDRLSNLEWNTQTENMRHAFKNKLIAMPKGVNHHKVKLTEKEVIEIRRLWETEKTMKTKLSKMFGVSKQQIARILNRTQWTHI